MTKREAFTDLVERFPFEEISERMNNKPRWYWKKGRERYVPTPMQLSQKAASMFDLSVKDPRGLYRLLTGGFTLFIEKNKITLSFGEDGAPWFTESAEYEEVLM